MPAAFTEITTSFGPGSGVGQEPKLNSCGASKIAAFTVFRSSRRASRRWILVLSILPLRLVLVPEVKEPHHEGEFSIERLIIVTSLIQTNPMRFKRQLSRDLPERPL